MPGCRACSPAATRAVSGAVPAPPCGGRSSGARHSRFPLLNPHHEIFQRRAPGAVHRRLIEVDALLAHRKPRRRHGPLPQALARACGAGAGGRHPIARTKAEADRRPRAVLSDPDMKEFAQEEIDKREDASMEQLEDPDLQKMLLPKDPNDRRNIFLEIRAGTGGIDEQRCSPAICCACARALPNVTRWQVEMISRIGLRNRRLQGSDHRASSAMALIRGLKFESGRHRVQRVPATETQGRIHTSACTVAIMPEADAKSGTSISIRPTLRIDTFRASGTGSQHINKTDSAAQHDPFADRHSGRMPGRPQPAPQNKAQAMKVLAGAHQRCANARRSRPSEAADAQSR